MILSKQRSLSNLYFSMLISTDSVPLSHYTCNWCKNEICDTLLIRRPVVHAPGQDWIPAYADKHPSEAPLSTPLALDQHTRGHGNKVLGGLEEHLASWTKGCEGQKGSGE